MKPLHFFSRLALPVLALLVLAAISTEPDPVALRNAAIERKVDSVLSLMTLEEKIGQMNQYNGYSELTGPGSKEGSTLKKHNDIKSGMVGSMLNVLGAKETREAQELVMKNSRMKIPMLFGYDVIHGYKTMFPIPLGEAASWDPAVAEASARIAAAEASAVGIHWTFAPMMDLARDARWGRVMEGSGEDPYLSSLFAAARVRGFQGQDLAAPTTIAACAKHFATYGFAEAGKDYNGVEISESTLRNMVLPPFKAAADAGVATFMNAFNDINGVPATAHVHLQRDILKGEWGFDGFVVSDWASIGELVPHGIAADNREAARLAVTAGSDMDMESVCYLENLAGLVRSGVVEERLIDDAVRRILRLKFRLGLFDDPYRYCNPERERSSLLTPEHLAAARDGARKSIVLLKNDGNLLPLSKTLKTIAVIGPLADDKDSPLGSWRAQAVAGSAVSLLEGVRAAAGPNTQVLYQEGCKLAVGDRHFVRELKINETDKSGFPAAVAAAKKAQVVLVAIGEDCWQTGEGRSQTDITLSGVQEALLMELRKVNPNIVLVLMNGRPLAIPWAAENVPAIVEAWHLGSEAGHAIADVLFGAYNPSGKLPISFPRSTGQVPIYYNHKSTGRPTGGEMVFWTHYTDERNDPLFPFGYGLSYTTFSYSEPRLSAPEMSLGRSGKLEVRVTVTNTGSVEGKETVQLYIRDLVGSNTRPVKELKAYRQITLRPGASQEVVFTLTPADLAFYTASGRWEAEPGDFQVMTGSNSRDVKMASFKAR
ncbi:MAG: beta-glucosidase BglX [Bacteroidia bacterium]|nr:beta-glucosidase BglX [Bacteroidia bacterium]